MSSHTTFVALDIQKLNEILNNMNNSLEEIKKLLKQEANSTNQDKILTLLLASMQQNLSSKPKKSLRSFHKNQEHNKK